MIYKWIHLSDVHFQDRNYNTDEMRRELITLLRSNIFNDTNYLFLTGDISNKGNLDKEKTMNFINEICQILNIENNNIFITPGNHDLKRNNQRNDIVKQIYSNDTPYDYLNNINPKDIEVLNNAQRYYLDFSSELLGHHLTPEKVHRCISDDNIVVLNINSSWASIEDNKNIVFGQQYLDCIKYDEINDKRLRVAISHYPYEWYSSIQQDRLLHYLQKNNFDLFLSGHTHESKVMERNSITFCNCRRLSADIKSLDTVNPGFVFGKVDTENNNERFIKFYTWVNSHSKWDIDNQVCTSVLNGIYSLNLNKYPSSNTENKALIKCSMTPRSTIDSIITKFNINNLNCEIDNENFVNWELEIKKNVQHLEALNNSVDIIFPIAPIPSLIHLGFLMQDSSKIKIMQYDDMDSKKWIYDEETKDFKLDISYKNKKKSELILKIAISHFIYDEQIEACLGNLNKYDIIAFNVLPSPKKCICLYHNQVARAKNILKNFLFNEVSLSKYERIHLFYSGPAGLAIEVGRIIQNNMWPPVYIYNFNQQYVFSIILNDKSP